MEELLKSKVTGYSLDKLGRAVKRGLYISFEPNVSAKIATLTWFGERFFNKYDMQIILTPKEQQNDR
jgi:hypothetical protein